MRASHQILCWWWHWWMVSLCGQNVNKLWINKITLYTIKWITQFALLISFSYLSPETQLVHNKFVSCLHFTSFEKTKGEIPKSKLQKQSNLPKKQENNNNNNNNNKQAVSLSWTLNTEWFCWNILKKQSVPLAWTVNMEWYCLMNLQSLWEYDTENHTEKSKQTEKPLKPHWKALQKIIIHSHWNFLFNHTEIYLLLLSKNVIIPYNPTEIFHRYSYPLFSQFSALLWFFSVIFS